MLQEGRRTSEADALAALFPHNLHGNVNPGAALSVTLPEGEILTAQSIHADPANDPTPLCWISYDPPPPRLLAALRADHRGTRLWPLLLCDDDEVYGDRCTVGVVEPEPLEHIDRWRAADVLSRIWNALCQDDDLGPAYDPEALAPYGVHCPGPARPGNLLADPDILANQQAAHFVDEDTRIALVPVRRGADVMPALGWSGAANHVSRTAGLSALVRSWENRFGVRVLRLGPDRLDLSVAAPPHEHNHAVAVAAEHWAFCPDRVLQDYGTISAYAEEIRGRRTWSFWWE